MQNEENFDQCNRKDKKEKIECSTYMLICSIKSDKKISETVSLKLFFETGSKLDAKLMSTKIEQQYLN